MPTYRYTAVAGGGDGTVEAPNRSEAVRRLAARGVTPSTLVDAGAPGEGGAAGGAHGVAAAGGGGLTLGPAMSRGEMTEFMRELATAVSAGLPVVPALRTIHRSRKKERQRELLSRVIDDVEHGVSLSEAMRNAGRPFDELIVALVHAGEMAGRLGEVLEQATVLLDRSQKLRGALLGALLYPAIILALVVVAVIVVVTVVVPRVLTAVSGQLAALPLPTRIVQGAATFFADYWWLVLLVGAASVLGWARLYAQPAFRLGFDRLIVGAPVLGALVRDVSVSRFTRTLGTLTSAGLPVLTGLRITKATLGNRALEGAIDDVASGVSHGQTIADRLERTGYFPPLLVQIVQMGEKTGRLDTMLLQAASAFEERTEQAIRVFTSVFPPVLIVVLATLVGFVLVAILLPLLELQESIG